MPYYILTQKYKILLKRARILGDYYHFSLFYFRQNNFNTIHRFLELPERITECLDCWRTTLLKWLAVIANLQLFCSSSLRFLFSDSLIC